MTQQFTDLPKRGPVFEQAGGQRVTQQVGAFEGGIEVSAGECPVDNILDGTGAGKAAPWCMQSDKDAPCVASWPGVAQVRILLAVKASKSCVPISNGPAK